MNITDKLPPLPAFPGQPAPNPVKSIVGNGESFGDTLDQFVADVNEMQLRAELKTKQFMTGDLKDIHEVMAAAEEAGISMMLLLEIRNKALDGYKELMRTPV